jgi:dipeptidyl aminopeptidase/acylaminoacyl peptidase
LTIRDLFRLRWLDAPAIAPDATTVACVETTLDEAADTTRRRVLVVPTDGAGSPQVLDEIPDARQVAWSPDGSHLAVTGATGLWIWSADRPARCIVPDAVSDPDWSPAGDRLAVVRDERVIVLGSDGVGYTALGGPTGAAAPRWAPDGSGLAYLAGGRMWRVEPTPADPAHELAAPADVVTAFTWAPDGSALACLGRRNRRLIDVGQQLWVLDRAGGVIRRLAGYGDTALGSPVRGDDPRGTGRPALWWSRASGRIYVESTRYGRGPLTWFEPGGTASGQLLDGEHACLGVSGSATGRLATVVCGPDGPGDVYVLDEDGAESRRLTDADPALDDRGPTTRHFTVTGAGGGIDAWLTGAGSADRPRPLFVSVHGGPYYAVGWRFTFEVQRLAARGLAVLTLNPRGSSGRGDAFAAGNRGDWGGADADDVEAVIAAARTQPGVDGARVVVAGVSYGGFMAQWLLARGGRYCGGVSENGISDFAALWRGDPERRDFWELALGGPPASSPLYAERSPLGRADRVTAATLLIHAEDDENCPIAQSEAMQAALERAGRPVELVRLPGEGHLVNLTGRPSSRMRRAAAVDEWLDRVLAAQAE